jgi:V8-like Glu-specific endopeptidase
MRPAAGAWMLGVAWVAACNVDSACAEGLPFDVQPFEADAEALRAVPLPGAPEFAQIEDLQNALKDYGRPLRLDDNLVGLMTRYGFKVGLLSESDEVSPSLIAYDVHQEGARWIKLRFDEGEFGPHDTVTVSSARAGNSYTMTRDNLQEWNWYSPILYGTDTVRVQIQVSEFDPPRPIETYIEAVLSGTSAAPEPYPEETEGRSEQDPPEQQGSDEELACGEDTREPAESSAVARVMPARCAAFMLEGGLFLSAGHCFRDNRDIQQIEFNVPSSTIDGAPMDPDEADVYPVLVGSIRCSDCDSENLKHGRDWAVFAVGQNIQSGLKPDDAQKSDLRVAEASGARVGAALLGYGWDGDPMTASYTLQGAKGTVVDVLDLSADDVEIRHIIDAEGGNSGSPLLRVTDEIATNEVVGIHTGGRCDPPNSVPNSATAIWNQALKEAIASLQP